jgi:16S rRNA (uracil1498-N3)-methyltransferase
VSHRFFVSPDQLSGETVAFSADQARQLRTVLRLRTGDMVRVFDGHSPSDYAVRLTTPSSGQVEGTCPHAAEPATRLVAYPALLQRDKFEQVLQKLTEVGVTCVVPVLTARGLVREPPDEHRQTRWKSILREAAEQSGRGIVPTLDASLPFKDALRQAIAAGPTLVAYEQEHKNTLYDVLARLAAPSAGPPEPVVPPDPPEPVVPPDPPEPVGPSDATATVGPSDATATVGPSDATASAGPHEPTASAGRPEAGASPVSPEPGDVSGPTPRRTVSLFVGPEGGYTAQEAALAQREGAYLVSLGPRILRTETASPILAALVLYQLGDLSSPHHASDDRS